jgi:RNA polymerase sigma factor for flagellar operon FliA
VKIITEAPPLDQLDRLIGRGGPPGRRYADRRVFPAVSFTKREGLIHPAGRYRAPPGSSSLESEGTEDIDTRRKGSVVEREEAWRLFLEGRSPEARERLILLYAPLVRSCAASLRFRLPPEFELTDLVSNGLIGLIEALDRYDPSRRPDFVSYARKRITGAMIDGIRRESILPRSLYEKSKMVRAAEDELTAALSRTPGKMEMASYLGLDQGALARTLREVASSRPVSLDEVRSGEEGDYTLLETLEDREAPDPAALEEERRMRELVHRAVERLPERYRIVLELHYFHELTLKEVAEVLSLSPSRVSQMHNLALSRLRRSLDGSPARLSA